MPKRLVKSNTDKKLFGVAGGLAEYFNLDPTLVRVGFVVACIFCFFVGIAYVVMAMVMPSPEGTSAGTPPDPADAPPLDATTPGEGAEDSEERNRRQNRLFGLALVGMGVLIAVTRFEFFSWVTWALTAAALIIVGVVLLTRRFRVI